MNSWREPGTLMAQQGTVGRSCLGGKPQYNTWDLLREVNGWDLLWEVVNTMNILWEVNAWDLLWKVNVLVWDFTMGSKCIGFYYEK